MTSMTIRYLVILSPSCLAQPFIDNQVTVTTIAMLKISWSFPLSICMYLNETESLLGARSLKPVTLLSTHTAS